MSFSGVPLLAVVARSLTTTAATVAPQHTMKQLQVFYWRPMLCQASARNGSKLLLSWPALDFNTPTQTRAISWHKHQGWHDPTCDSHAAAVGCPTPQATTSANTV
jgi:hypothetical protein